MTQHTDFSTRLDDLQQRLAQAKSAVQAAGAESEAQLRQRIDRAQADLDQSVQNARHEVSQAADSARAKWAQLKADAAAKRSEVRASIEKRTRLVDAKVAAKDADWAEDDAADALDFADWAIENCDGVRNRFARRPARSLDRDCSSMNRSSSLGQRPHEMLSDSKIILYR